MIYLFAGDDVKEKHVAYAKLIKSLPAGQAGIPKSTETFFISRNEFNKAQLESLYSGSGLFFTKATVVLSGILEREENRDFILEKLSSMAESGNDFVFLEGKLTKPITDAFKKAGAKGNQFNIFELPKERIEKFNSFSLANAFGDRDKLNLWINFRLAMGKGVAMEELTGILFWKAKDMLIKKNFGKFSRDELQNFAAKISYLLPEARKNGRDDESAFEQFLLEAF